MRVDLFDKVVPKPGSAQPRARYFSNVEDEMQIEMARVFAAAGSTRSRPSSGRTSSSSSSILLRKRGCENRAALTQRRHTAWRRGHQVQGRTRIRGRRRNATGHHRPADPTQNRSRSTYRPIRQYTIITKLLIHSIYCRPPTADYRHRKT